jgi:hypothetical protein
MSTNNMWIAYVLLLVGMPIFVGMFISSFVIFPVSKLIQKSPAIQRWHVPLLEALSGVATAVAGAFLFRILGLTPDLLVPSIMALWISIYCLAAQYRLRAWLGWLSGLIIGWLAVAMPIVSHLAK